MIMQYLMNGKFYKISFFSFNSSLCANDINQLSYLPWVFTSFAFAQTYFDIFDSANFFFKQMISFSLLDFFYT